MNTPSVQAVITATPILRTGAKSSDETTEKCIEKLPLSLNEADPCDPKVTFVLFTLVITDTSHV